MKPYYEHAGIALYHGETLDVLPSLPALSIDAVVTDPPYLATGSESSWVSRDGAKSLPRETQFYEAWLREQMALWVPKLKPSGAIWFTCDWAVAATFTTTDTTASYHSLIATFKAAAANTAHLMTLLGVGA